MNQAQEMALSFLVNQNVVEQESSQIMPMVGPLTEAALGIKLPVKGSIGAREFLVTRRDAGKRMREDILADGRTVKRSFHDPGCVRNDTICAIHAYIGYNPDQAFGVQDSLARDRAVRETRGPMALTAARSVVGQPTYTPGMPSYHQRTLCDLAGREAFAANALLQHEKDAQDTTRSPEARTLSAGLAQVERERVLAIRADMDRAFATWR